MITKNFLLVIVALTGGLAGRAAGQNRIVDGVEEAILYSETLNQKEQKIQFLLHYGRVFIEDEKYDDARKVAQFILIKLDRTSLDATELLEEAAKRKEEKMLRGSLRRPLIRWGDERI